MIDAVKVLQFDSRRLVGDVGLGRAWRAERGLGLPLRRKAIADTFASDLPFVAGRHEAV